MPRTFKTYIPEGEPTLEAVSIPCLGSHHMIEIAVSKDRSHRHRWVPLLRTYSAVLFEPVVYNRGAGPDANENILLRCSYWPPNIAACASAQDFYAAMVHLGIGESLLSAFREWAEGVGVRLAVDDAPVQEKPEPKPRGRHWFDKIKRSFDENIPLRLSPGEASSLWRCLFDSEVMSAEIADIRASHAGRFLSGYGEAPTAERESERFNTD